MAARTLTVRRNRDETVTIRSGRYIESIDIRFKSPYEKYEYIRSAIVTAGFEFTPHVEEMVRKELYSEA